MGYKIKTSEFNALLDTLRRSYRVWAPVSMSGKGPYSGTDLIGYGEINKIEEIIFNQKTVYSAKESIFKPVETLFYFTEEEFKQPKGDGRKVLIFARPCDINAFKRLDDIFLDNGPYQDPYYLRQREQVKFVLMECGEGYDNCFCVSMGTNMTEEYSIAVRPEGNYINCLVKDDELKSYFHGCIQTEDMVPRFVHENKIILQVPNSLGPAEFDNPLWQEYTARCTGCGRCNLACPTCSCFTMQDIFYRDNPTCGERRRVWASCMIDGFTEMAGGHGYRNKQGDRMRFKVMHKFHDFNKRFGYHMCVGCGRCDDICPEYISIVKCVEKLNRGSQEVHKL